MHGVANGAKMIDLVPVGIHQMDSQMPSTRPDIQTGSRHSSDIEVEIAQQLLQHARGRPDVNDIRSSTAPTSHDPTQNGIIQDHLHTDKSLMNGKSQYNTDPRRSPSQDQMSESQYAPLKDPPAMGQVCR